MAEEVVIKQEPLDYDENETFNGDSDFMLMDHVKVEYEDNSYETNTEDVPTYSPTSSSDDRLSILAEKPNLITVCATEAIKLEDELNIIGQLMPEEDHAYARLEYNRQNCYKTPSVPIIVPKVTKDPKHFECRKNCDRKFKTLTERAWHESYDHETKSRNIKCNFCNKNFESFFALTRHMPEHRNVQTYVCTHCSISFDSYQSLQFHWKTNAGCCKKEMETKQKISEDIFEEKKNIVIPNKSQLSNKVNSSTNKDAASSSYKPKLQTRNENNIITPLASELQQTPPALPKKELSFAEEIKAFAAKYQLKNNLVAKKRTSPMVILPSNTKRRKNAEGTLFEKFETISQYAIPNAIGPSNSGVSNPIINVKIKEEPEDQYDEQFLDDANPISIDETETLFEPFCDVQVKNEPIVDSHEETIEPNIAQNDMERKFIYVSSPESEMQMKSNHSHCDSSQSDHSESEKNCFKIIKIDSSNSKFFDTKTFPSKDTPEVNQSVINNSKMPLKNIKILKLAPNARIVKLPLIKVTPIKNDDETFKNSTEAKDESSDAIPKFTPIKLPFSSAKKNSSISKETTNDLISIKIETPIKQETKEENTISKKRNTMPKNLLRCIESQPQSIKIIEDLQRKIEQAENTNAITLPMSENDEIKTSRKNAEEEPSKEPLVASNPKLPAPISLYLKPTEINHAELFTARSIYQNYRFSWLCPYCPMMYDMKPAFLSHLFRIHKMSREECEKLIVEVRPFHIDADFPSYSKYRCPNCLRTCSSRSMLNDHIAGNCGRIPLYKCSECPKAFYSANTLNSHRSIHTGELPYKCNYCDKRFRTPGQVRVHHRSHTGERPFACQICSQRFAHRETLISHLSRHIGMKRYRCYACGKHFSCVSGLKNHHELRPNTCGRVKLNTRAVGPRVRVIRGQVHFEAQPDINPYLRTEDPQDILTEIQNIQKTSS